MKKRLKEGGPLHASEGNFSFDLIQIGEKIECERHLELESNFAELERLEKELTFAVAHRHNGQMFIAGVHELVANAIEHGNRTNPGKTVTVIIVVGKTKMYALIQDQGEGFNWPDHMQKPVEITGSQERGRGIALTHLCSDMLIYNKKGNQVILTARTG